MDIRHLHSLHWTLIMTSRGASINLHRSIVLLDRNPLEQMAVTRLRQSMVHRRHVPCGGLESICLVAISTTPSATDHQMIRLPAFTEPSEWHIYATVN